MNFTIADNWDDMEFGGSGLVGTINITKELLVHTLGKEPQQLNGEQIKERWLIRFEDGTKATIFRDIKCEQDEWLIGGFGHYDKKTKENISLRAVKQLFPHL